MKRAQNTAMPPDLSAELKLMGEKIARMRKARHMLQSEAAVRANISRETASRIERGDAAVAIGQVSRYLEAIVPGGSFASLFQHDSALGILEQGEKRQRARKLTPKELMKYDF